MTDIQPYTDPATLPTLGDEGTALIERTLEQMSGAHQLAKALANTAFVPYQWRGKPDDVAAAILYGAAIGLDPMSALRGLYVVNGNPGMYARQMVALVMSKGHTVRTVEVSDTSATVSGRRRGSDDVETVTWTIERAKQAGYVPTVDPKTGKWATNERGKVIGNEKYLTDPRSMLYARASGDVCRRIAPDALAGLDYSVEELSVLNVESEVVRDRPKRESAAALLTSMAPAEPAQPAEPELVEDVPEPAAAPEPITDKQLRKLGMLMRDANITVKSDALAYVDAVIGRQVASRAELSTGEADAVLAALAADLAQPEQAEQQAAAETTEETTHD